MEHLSGDHGNHASLHKNNCNLRNEQFAQWTGASPFEFEEKPMETGIATSKLPNGGKAILEQILWIAERKKCDYLRDLVPFVLFKKREKHPWRSISFSKDTGWSMQLKVTPLHGYFSRFLNYTNGNKSRNTPNAKEQDYESHRHIST